MKNSFILLAAWLLTTACVQQTATPLKEEMTPLKEAILELAPYLYDKEAFKAQKNHQVIQTALTQLKEQTRAMRGHPTLQEGAMLFTIEELQIQLDEALENFSEASKDVARWQVTSSLGLCLQCHSQSPTSPTLKLTEKEMQALPQETIERANILFILRDYNHAEEAYLNLLEKTHSFDSQLNRLYKAFNRLLFLYVRIQQDFDKALDLIKKARVSPHFPHEFKQQVEQLQDFIDKQVFYRPVVAHLNDEELTDFLSGYQPEHAGISIEDDLYSAEELLDLWLAGELFTRLENKKPPTLRAKILHTLALIDERTSENIFYSLSNRYLEECIHLVPRSNQALSCYQSLEERLLFSYSGSRGVDLPSDVEEKLRKLQKEATPTSP